MLQAESVSYSWEIIEGTVTYVIEGNIFTILDKDNKEELTAYLTWVRCPTKRPYKQRARNFATTEIKGKDVIFQGSCFHI